MSLITTKIDLRRMSENDLEFVNRIRNHDSTRKFLRNTEVISLQDTRTWFDLKNPKWYIISHLDEDVGYIRTSQDTGESICIGCDIAVDKRGRGFAKLAYKKILDDLYEKDYNIIWLEVFDDNHVAKNLYTSLGFIEVNTGFKNNRQRITMVHVRKENV